MAKRCPDCDGTGFRLHTDDAGRVSSARCGCRDEAADRLRLRAARIPRRYDHCSFDSFELHHPSHAEASSIVREWFDLWPGAGHGLFLLGRPGRGKTHLAVAVARALIEQKGATVAFVEQRDLLKSLQGTFEEGAETRQSEVLRPVLEADLTVLDDLGAGRTTAWARDVLHDLIVHRYNNDRPLLMTSNLEVGDEERAPGGTSLSLRDRLGDALMSRLYEMCRFVQIGGRDYREGVKNAHFHI